MIALRGWCPGLFEPMPTGDGLLVRVKPPGGVLGAAAARLVAQAASAHGSGEMALTGRASLQCRGFSARSAPLFAEAIVAAGLASADPDAERERQRVAVQRIERRGLDADGAPVRAERIRHDLRQRGIDALPMLCLGRGDGDMPVLADLQPRPEHRLAGARRQVRRVPARPQSPSDDEPYADPAGNKQGAAVERHGVALAEADGRDEASPSPRRGEGRGEGV